MRAEETEETVVSNRPLFAKERNNNSEKINCIGINSHGIG